MAGKQLGIDIPEQLSIVGTGNSSEGQKMRTSLSSIGMSDESIDSALVLLLERLDGNISAAALIEPWQLFHRQTTCL